MPMPGGSRARLWLAAILSSLSFWSVSLFAGSLLPLTAGARGWYRAVMALFGLGAGGLVYAVGSARQKRKPQPTGASELREIDDAVTAVRKRLAASSVGRGAGTLGKLPLILFMGPRSSAKTSIILHSGLDPEILSGDVERAGAVVPTPTVNAWLAGDTVLVEAGSRVTSDEQRWLRLVQHLRPSRMGASFSKAAQASRQAVICVPCDELVNPGSAESFPALARKLRAQLGDLAQRFGIRLPVYVFFTRADRLPYFTEFVRGLSRDDVHDVFGATLPLQFTAAGGPYADAEAARLTAAFQDLFGSLAARRIDVLRTEPDEDVRNAAYEFPREFRKLGDLIVQFLVELCRPSQLGANPLLRGFYFCGVRPIVVADEDRPMRAGASNAFAEPAADATSVFSLRSLQAESRARPAEAGTRRVPQWVFLKRLFHDVILADEVARGVTGRGTRVAGLRRFLAAAVIVLLLVAGVGATISWRNNVRLAEHATAALTGVAGLREPVTAPADRDALAALDALREQTARVAQWERGWTPLSYQWGLYSGGRLDAQLRTVYFDRLGNLLWARTRGRIEAALLATPNTVPTTEQYDSIFAALKAYMIITEYPDSGDIGLVTEQLTRYWAAGEVTDEERLVLVRAQFGFLDQELKASHRPVLGTSIHGGAIQRAREFLNRLRGLDPVYRALTTQASRAIPAVDFASGPVRSAHRVPGAYTKAGWDSVTALLDRPIQRESWVLGPDAGQASDAMSPALKDSLMQRYRRDYVEQWQRFLSEASVTLGPPDRAAASLTELSSPNSPLLGLLARVAYHTNVDSANVGAAFQPVRGIVDAAGQPPYGTPRNEAYLRALGTLQQQLSAVATPGAGPDVLAAVQQVNAAAAGVRTEASGLRPGAALAGGARVTADAVHRLLIAPADIAGRLAGGQPSAQINAIGRQYCPMFGEVSGLYPFSPGGGDARPDQVDNLLKPNDGALWRMGRDLEEAGVVQRGGAGFDRGRGPLQAEPGVREFLTRAFQLSRALYATDGGYTEVSLGVRSRPPAGSTVRLSVDGTNLDFTETIVSSRGVRWSLDRSRSARLEVSGAAPIQTVGSWALLRLFDQASSEKRSETEYAFTFTRGLPAPVVVEIQLQNRLTAVLFDRNATALRCEPVIVRGSP